MNKGIQKMFSGIPQTYEFLNHLLTWGLDILLRKRAARIATADGGKLWIDVCSGTGEMAVCLKRIAAKDTIVIGADFCLPMLKKAVEKDKSHGIFFAITDSCLLPFRDQTFDLVTISFATRNINVTPENFSLCLREFHRILKPGGRFVNLETSQPTIWIIKKLFHLYVRLMIKSVGAIISGAPSAYAYLANTIPRFYNAAEFAEIVRKAGFSKVTFDHMFFGIAAIHRAIK